METTTVKTLRDVWDMTDHPAWICPNCDYINDIYLDREDLTQEWLYLTCMRCHQGHTVRPVDMT